MVHRALRKGIIGGVLHKCCTDRDIIRGHGEGVAIHRDGGIGVASFINIPAAQHVTLGRCGGEGHHGTFHGCRRGRDAAMIHGGAGDVVGNTRPAFFPDDMSIFWMVDEGVAVALDTKNGIVAVNFLLADGVVVAPAQKHVDSPVLDDGLVGHATATPIGIFAVVAHTHVHNGTGKVALVFVDRLKDFAIISQRRLARSQFRAILRSPCGITYLTIGEVAPLVVHKTIGGEDMMKVGGRRAGVIEPTLWPRVLTIEAVTFLLVGAALVIIIIIV